MSENDILEEFSAHLGTSSDITSLDRVIDFWRGVGDEEPHNTAVDTMQLANFDSHKLGQVCLQSARKYGYTEATILSAIREILNP